MPLTVTQARNAKLREKSYRLFDGGGLYLEVAPSGGKWWRLKYRVGGKEKRISLGVFPEVSLAQARERREDARKLIAEGVCPSFVRQQAKALEVQDEETFELVAREWFAKFSENWSESHATRIIRRLEKDVFPFLGQRPVREVEPPELLATIRRIESRGVLETAHRALQNCGQVWRYAVATGRATRDISQDLRGALAPTKETHLASITDPKGVAALLRAIDDYQGSHVVRCALRLAPLVCVRPGELRQAEWTEIGFDAGEWRIPAGKMKSRALHVVPLSQQAVEVLREVQILTGEGRWIFPNARTRSKPMSNMALNNALRRMGYESDEMTAHGFRSMASTMLNEQGWNRDAIERQLAHAERDTVRAAYNYAEHLPERRRMMQAWADYLDSLKAGAKVTPIRVAKGLVG